MKELEGVILTFISILIGLIIGGYVTSKLLTIELNESLKKVGYKILSIFAIFNLFNFSSSEMQDNNSTNEKTN